MSILQEMKGKTTAFIHPASYLHISKKFSSPGCSRRCLIFATADEVTKSPARSGVNISKYKSQRSVISADRRELTAVEVNDLMVKAGKESRDIEKWKRALKGSFLVVFARLVSDGKLVGFARATSDKSLNGTIWDVVADPSLPDQGLMKRNIVRYILKELRRTVPGCSIALFSDDNDNSFYEAMEFVTDPDGIKGMALFDESGQTYM